MVRPKNCRLIGQPPEVVYYKPQGIPLRELEETIITLDELEAMRLCDQEGLYHEKAAEEMGVSRATLGRILEEARRKVITALLQGNALRIEGGKIKVMEQRIFQCNECSHNWKIPTGIEKPGTCPNCSSVNLCRASAKTACCSGEGNRHHSRQRKHRCCQDKTTK